MKQRDGTMAAAVLVVVALGLCGCATQGQRAGPGTEDNVATLAPEPMATLLNVRVNTRAADTAATTVAADVEKAVQGALVGQGFKMDAAPPDVEVDLVVSTRLFDRSGEYYLHDGTVDVAVRWTRSGQLLGQRQLTLRGERKLGESEALRSLSAKLAAETAAWVAERCRPEVTKLATDDVMLTRRSFRWRAADDSAYAQLFVKRVAALPGVVDCRLVNHDYASRRLVFRVVYYREAFPEGLLNRLALINELDIKPGM